MLVDTDVIIWYIRGHKKAKAAIDRLDEFVISAVTHMEILQGLSNKSELKQWRDFLKVRHVQLMLIKQEVSSKAIYWMEEFTLSHGLRMADALIAATADIHRLTLLTGNVQDYKFLPGLSLKRFKS